MKIITVVFAVSFLCISNILNSQYNGWYCANVEYSNHKTRTYSTYRLTVLVKNDALAQLNFPSGGHLDVEDFGFIQIKNNQASIYLTGGKSYKVSLIKKGTDCFVDVPKAVQCKALTKAGNKCKNKTDDYSGFCWRHRSKTL